MKDWLLEGIGPGMPILSIRWSSAFGLECNKVGESRISRWEIMLAIFIISIALMT